MRDQCSKGLAALAGELLEALPLVGREVRLGETLEGRLPLGHESS
jgi:hypothetical protein